MQPGAQLHVVVFGVGTREFEGTSAAGGAAGGATACRDLNLYMKADSCSIVCVRLSSRIRYLNSVYMFACLCLFY